MFSEGFLLQYLPDLNQPARFWVAYSGGMDSHVLLAALAMLLARQPNAIELKAVHVNHALNPDADAWEAHCRAVCQDLGVPLQCFSITVQREPGLSLETQARHLRYQAFSSLLRLGDYLLQAHHQDDQLETVLFRLLRGSGPRGLAGIPARRPLGQGELLRPLLTFPRAALREWAQRHDIRWVEDESNTNVDFDRNYLRREIFPLLARRWPGFADNWQRTARLCAEADALQRDLAAGDFAEVRADILNAIDLAGLMQWPAYRQRNLLRYWFDTLGETHGLPSPDHNALQRIVEEVVPAARDATPLVSWSRGDEYVEIRRFQGRLYALVPPPDMTERELSWDPAQPLQIAPGLGALSLEEVKEGGFSLADVGTFTVRFKAGGETVRPAGRRTRPLKKIFQDYGVPPWLRDKVPLIYDGAELVAVGDLLISEGRRLEKGGRLYRVRWERSDIHCGY